MVHNGASEGHIGYPDLPPLRSIRYDDRVHPPCHCPTLLAAVYHFRPFRNADPPRLVEIWRDQPAQRGLMQPITAVLLEQFVFAKPYFDPEGLILAFAGDTAVGFVHAGFGPNDSETDLCTEFGTTYQLMLRAHHRDNALADELLARAEAYLRDRGAKIIYAGGIRPLNAFYLGLYGGSELPGVLISDPVLGPACVRNGYCEVDRVAVMECELARFRPCVNRQQWQLRRQTTIRETYAPPIRTWWEACTIADFERLHFSLTMTKDEPPLAEVEFWNIEPLSSRRGISTAGMWNVSARQDRRRQGLATFLLSEAFERLRSRGIMLVEAQTMRQNAPAIALYEKLGFTHVDEGIVYRKT